MEYKNRGLNESDNGSLIFNNGVFFFGCGWFIMRAVKNLWEVGREI